MLLRPRRRPRRAVGEPVDHTPALAGEPGLPRLLRPPDARRRAPHRAVATRSRPARSRCGWTARSPVSASTRGGRRWCGRRGPGTGWSPCEVDRDDTGGLNKDGDVVLHVPDDHQASIIAARARRVAAVPPRRARCRASRPTPPRPGSRGHRLHRRRHRADGAHARSCTARRSVAPTARPGSGSALQRHPVLASDEPGTLEVDARPRRCRRGSEVPHFAESAPRTGTSASTPSPGRSQLGPAVRRSGRRAAALRRRAAARCATLTLTSYRSGGGRRGQRDRRPGAGAEDERALRRPRREPRPGGRRRPTPRRWRRRRSADRCCCAPADER